MHQTVLKKFFFRFFEWQIFKKVHIKNFKTFPTKDSWPPHICHRYHSSASVKVSYLNIFFFFGHLFLHFLGECLAEKTWLCKTNEKYDVCSCEGFIRRIQLQSQLLIWFLICSRYFQALHCITMALYCIALYCIVLYCIVLLISRGTGSSSYKAKQFDLLY